MPGPLSQHLKEGLPVGRGKGEVVVVFADSNVRTYPSAAGFDLVVRAAL